MGNVTVARVYEAGTAEEWKSMIAIAAKQLRPPAPITGPVAMTLRFYFPRPKGHYGAKGLRPAAPLTMITKPDLDNLEKAVMDCLTRVGFWRDDSQVNSKMSSKAYADFPRPAGMVVSISADWPVTDPTQHKQEGATP
jgi:Holliday junction resolvase RusA-like endonuclease